MALKNIDLHVLLPRLDQTTRIQEQGRQNRLLKNQVLLMSQKDSAEEAKKVRQAEKSGEAVIKSKDDREGGGKNNKRKKRRNKLDVKV